MKNEGVNRSPLFYVGDKYKLISEIKTHFPQTIDRFVEPFVGGGSVFLNVEAKEFTLNDIDSKVIALHQFLCSQSSQKEAFFESVFNIIDEYGLSCSYRRDDIAQELKEQFKKTYFARYNKQSFNHLKTDFNTSYRSDMMYLYILLIYGFNHMLRFNAKGEYNLPVGNVDFNANVYKALNGYFDEVLKKKISFSNEDFRKFISRQSFGKNDLVYLDPPYLISASEYNKIWSESLEKDLLVILDELDAQGIRFAISNVVHYRDLNFLLPLQ